jgi:hypothetical protein
MQIKKSPALDINWVGIRGMLFGAKEEFLNIMLKWDEVSNP